MRRQSLVLIAGWLVFTSVQSVEGGVPGKAAIGDVVKDLAAKDILGATFSLARVDRDKLVVFAFLGVDCPLLSCIRRDSSNSHANTSRATSSSLPSTRIDKIR